MKKVTILSLILTASINAFAQKDARVQLQLGNWSSPDDKRGVKLAMPLVNTVSFTAEHKVYKNLGLKFGYSRWQTLRSRVNNFYPFMNKDFREDKITEPGAVGRTSGRTDYQMVTATAQYRYRIKHSEVYANAGVSYAFGKDIILESVFYYGPGYDVLADYVGVKSAYTGFVWEVGYNYLLLKDRVNVGVSINNQRYSVFNLYTLKLNVGYNFNVFKARVKDKSKAEQ